MKLRVGDIVVGNKYNEYGISGQGSICKVVLIFNDIDMRVKIIEPRGHYIRDCNAFETERQIGKEFNVQTKYFDLKKPLLTENE